MIFFLLSTSKRSLHSSFSISHPPSTLSTIRFYWTGFFPILAYQVQPYPFLHLILPIVPNVSLLMAPALIFPLFQLVYLRVLFSALFFSAFTPHLWLKYFLSLPSLSISMLMILNFIFHSPVLTPLIASSLYHLFLTLFISGLRQIASLLTHPKPNILSLVLLNNAPKFFLIQSPFLVFPSILLLQFAILGFCSTPTYLSQNTYPQFAKPPFITSDNFVKFALL